VEPGFFVEARGRLWNRRRLWKSGLLWKPGTLVPGQPTAADRALALVRRMSLAPQDSRTFFVTSVTFDRHAIFQSTRMTELLIDIFNENQEKGRDVGYRSGKRAV